MWLALSALGVAAAQRLSGRIKALENVLSLFQKIGLEIRQFSRPLPQLVEQLAGEENGERLAGMCVGFMKAGDSFPLAWKKGTDSCSLPFKREERKMLSRLGKELSSCDREGCFQVLDAYTRRFTLLLEEARATGAKYSKLCFFSGVFIGGMVFITMM